MRIFAPEIDASSRAMRRSICIGPNRKIRQIFNQRTQILMPFASAYVMVLYHCILKHRIRLKVGFILGRRLAMPAIHGTNNASSMLFPFVL